MNRRQWLRTMDAMMAMETVVWQSMCRTAAPAIPAKRLLIFFEEQKCLLEWF